MNYNKHLRRFAPGTKVVSTLDGEPGAVVRIAALRRNGTDARSYLVETAHGIEERYAGDLFLPDPAPGIDNQPNPPQEPAMIPEPTMQECIADIRRKWRPRLEHVRRGIVDRWYREDDHPEGEEGEDAREAAYCAAEQLALIAVDALVDDLAGDLLRERRESWDLGRAMATEPEAVRQELMRLGPTKLASETVADVLHRARANVARAADLPLARLGQGSSQIDVRA